MRANQYISKYKVDKLLYRLCIIMMSETEMKKSIEKSAIFMGLEYAEKVQSALHLYSPKHCSPEDLQWFKTICVHLILDHTLIEPLLRFEFPDEDFSFFQIMEDFPTISFSVGYDDECICKTLHDMHLFESEMVALEIGRFASTETRIALGYECTVYSTTSDSWRVQDVMGRNDEGLLASILEACPTLVMITDLLVLIKSIVEAHTAVNGSKKFSENYLEWIEETFNDRNYSPDIVSIFWPYDWSTQHRVYQRRGDQAELKEILWSELSETLEDITPEICLRVHEKKESGGSVAMLTYLLEKQKESVKQGRKLYMQDSLTGPNKKRKF